MSYLPFAYPKPGTNLQDLLLDSAGPVPPPPSFPPAKTGSRHYHTWRNAIAREAIKEKEGAKSAAENNPEEIPGRVTERYQDQNFIQCFQPLLTFRPQSLTDEAPVAGENRREQSLKKIIQIACEKGLKAKAVGTGHSFSDVMTTPDFLVVTDDLNEMLEYDFVDSTDKKMMEINIAHYPLLREKIRKEGYAEFIGETDDEDRRPALVEFEAGIKLFDLTDALWKRGWSLYNLGTYQGQSFIGASSTSTHGSGLTLGPLPDMIRSMVLVADEGIVYRIEPDNGITNTENLSVAAPEHFPKNMSSESGAEVRIYASQNDRGVDYLIQDDGFFNAALVNVGTFGIVYSVIIQVIPRLCLLETAELTTWEDLQDRLKDPAQYAAIFETKEFISTLKFKAAVPAGYEAYEQDGFLRLENIRQTSMLFNPNYYNRSDKKRIFFRITRQYEVPYKLVVENDWLDDNDRGRLLDPKIKKIMQPIFDIIGERLAKEEPEQTRLYELKEKLICGTILFEQTAKSDMLKTMDKASPFLGWLADLSQEDLIQALLDGALKNKTLNMIADTIFKADDTANSIVSSGPILPKENEFYFNRNYRVHIKSSDLNGYGIETGFRFEKLESETVPQYITAIQRAIDIAEEHWLEGRYMQTATTAVRFVQGTPAYLSPQYGYTTCMIEMLNVADTHGGKELFYRFQKEFEKMNARPHWGLDLSVTTGNNKFLERTYPKFPLWKRVYDLFNVHGTFDNRFTDRMGLSVQRYQR